MEVDEATNPLIDYTKGLGNVRILLRSEELAHLVEMHGFAEISEAKETGKVLSNLIML
jgi:hypothetical protein